MGLPGISDAAAEVLHRVFGYDSFRGQQQEIIEHVCAGGDAIALMPTGSGKSLCYQIPALVREGTGVVISPLIALMQDQVDALTVLGVRAGFLNSTQDPDERRGVEYAFLDGKLDLLYLAPERLRTESALRLLDRGTVALFAIDEAHCVAQWGHDFRPDYLALSVLHERWPTVPRIAVTATATAQTREEIAVRLSLGEARQSWPASTGLISSTGSSRRTSRGGSCSGCCGPSTQVRGHRLCLSRRRWRRDWLRDITNPLGHNPGIQTHILTLTPSKTDLGVGEGAAITATYDGRALDGTVPGAGPAITVSDPSVIGCCVLGAPAYSVGKATLTATYGGSTASIDFTVHAQNGISAILFPSSNSSLPASWTPPGGVTVAAGSTIMFEVLKVANTSHNVVFDAVAGAPDDVIQDGKTNSANRVFSTPGIFTFSCTIHGETGMVKVVAQ